MTTVLLVDDEPMNIEVFSEALADTFKVFTAENGEVALAILKAHHIDILVTDVRMPRMDGITLAKYARELHPEIPVLLISGWVGKSPLEYPLLEKPFHIDQLKEAIQAELKKEAAGSG